MAVTLFPNLLAASGSGSLVFIFEQLALPGWLILLALFFASIFSWAVMITKFRVIRHAQRRRDQFLSLFRTDRQPLRIYTDRLRFDGAPLFAVYKAGCQELTFQLLGSADVDETFRGRLDAAPRISSAQMRVVNSAMERAVGETALKLESQMIILATAVSGAPFLGLLGTVWGVMETFSGIAIKQAASLTAMAPGVAGALIATVVGLFVAIPAMFAYNFMVTMIRSLTQELDNFVTEFATSIEHAYVDNRPMSEEIADALKKMRAEEKEQAAAV